MAGEGERLVGAEAACALSTGLAVAPHVSSAHIVILS